MFGLGWLAGRIRAKYAEDNPANAVGGILRQWTSSLKLAAEVSKAVSRDLLEAGSSKPGNCSNGRCAIHDAGFAGKPWNNAGQVDQTEKTLVYKRFLQENP